MRYIKVLLPLALIISFLSGQFGIVTAVLAAAALWEIYRLYLRFSGKDVHMYSLWNISRFLVQFLWEMTKSNIILAFDVLYPKDIHDVMLIEVPIDDLTDIELALLAYRINLTPGTLTCAASTDRQYLLVHEMYPGDDLESLPQKLRRPIDILKGTDK